MSKDLSQEEANLAVATALMREVVDLRAENARLRTFMQRQAAAIRTLHECEKTEINRLRKEQHKWLVANSTLDSEREANALLTDENARLREALRPLAEARLFAGSDYWVISSEDMERARAALKETEE